MTLNGCRPLSSFRERLELAGIDMRILSEAHGVPFEREPCPEPRCLRLRGDIIRSVGSELEAMKGR